MLGGNLVECCGVGDNGVYCNVVSSEVVGIECSGACCVLVVMGCVAM